jgi:cytochrome b561
MSRESFHHPLVRVLHLLVVLGMLIQFGLFYLADWSQMKDYKGFLFMLHKSTGNLMVLIVLFLIWAGMRFGRPDHQLPRIQLILATLVKILLVVSMLAMSISGYLMTSAGHYGYRFYGLFDMPLLDGLSKEVGENAHFMHGFVGTVVLVLVAMHAAAALFHHFVNHDGVLKSMWGRRT